MYFSRHEFTARREVAEEAGRGAEDAVRLARQHFGVHLDGSYESLAVVEQTLERVRELLRERLDQQTAEPFARPFGAYVGELLRERHGGEWGVLRVYSDYVPALSLGTRGIVLVPWARALERILEGPTKDLEEYCERVRQAVEAPDAAAPERPARQHFPLRHDQGYFDTGTTGDGRQVLMSFFWTGLTAIFFDREGNLLEWEVRPLPREPETHPVTGCPLHGPEFDAAVAAAMRSWKRELRLQEEPIRVRRFSIEELEVGIEELPDHYEEFLKAPELEEPDEEGRHEMWEGLRRWQESGAFVLYWGNDLWLDGEGNVTSS